MIRVRKKTIGYILAVWFAIDAALCLYVENTGAGRQGAEAASAERPYREKIKDKYFYVTRLESIVLTYEPIIFYLPIVGFIVLAALEARRRPPH